ncbi:hypothetical protein J3E69DRAFT_161858 [Trichoderma sp. SZMC 28015]
MLRTSTCTQPANGISSVYFPFGALAASLFFSPSPNHNYRLILVLPSSTKKCIHTKRQHILVVSICCGISLPSGHTSESSFARKQPNSIAVAAYRPLQRATKVLGQTTQCNYRETLYFQLQNIRHWGSPLGCLCLGLTDSALGVALGPPRSCRLPPGIKSPTRGATTHPITSTAALTRYDASRFQTTTKGEGRDKMLPAETSYGEYEQELNLMVLIAWALCCAMQGVVPRKVAAYRRATGRGGEK